MKFYNFGNVLSVLYHIHAYFECVFNKYFQHLDFIYLIKKRIEKKMKADYDLDTVDDCDRPNAIFYHFKEHGEITKLITKFPSLINDLRAKERSYERFLCKNYQKIYF